MKVLFAVISLVIISLVSVYVLTGYRSAFEADQACHAARWNNYEENSSFDCDHDIETHQWILFEPGATHQSAKVIKRFSY